jgi:uncharacterized membrane protein (UPF0127 family)
MDVIINNNLFNVKCVMTSKDTQTGMMGKKFDESFDGMLFMMSDGEHSFWMKDCIIPLDIIFIKANTISKIHHNCKPCLTKECDRYSGDGDLILEVYGGTCEDYDIKEGDRVYFD